MSIVENEKISSFSNSVYESHMEKHQLNTNLSARTDCCRHEAGWSDCMDCTVEACGRSWFCVASLVVAGPEVLAGFAVSCIGAGPNTFC